MARQRKWFLRPYQPGDEVALTALFQRVFGREITIDHWFWKFKSFPTTVENVWVVQDREKLVGHYAAMPMWANFQGQIQPIMVSVDTMVDPDYRRQGMLTVMGEQIYKIWAEAGIAYVIGLPNEKWGSRAQRLGWQPLFPLQWLARPLRPEVYLAHRLNVPLLARLSFVSKVWHWLGWRRMERDTTVSLSSIQQAGPEFDVLWQSCAQNRSFSTVRDQRWVQWRFLDCPSTNYHLVLAQRHHEPVGYGAYYLHVENRRTIGFIAEILTKDNDIHTFSTISHGIEEQMRQSDVDMIVTQAVPGSCQHAQWRRIGFYPRRAAFGVQLVPLLADWPLTAMQVPDNWFISGADFDVI